MEPRPSSGPPAIVAASEDRAAALTTFIAQELEHAGFGVASDRDALWVRCGDLRFVVGTLEVAMNRG